MKNNEFIFGVSASAFQIEGDDGTQGRGQSVWDTFCEYPGTVYCDHNGKQGVDHYNRFKEDVSLMSELGVNAYRFSTSWPRLLPEGTGRINQKGLDFYDRLIDELLSKGIEPVLTEYHWDLPEKLGEKGGFRNPDFSSWFEEYTTLLVKHYGDRVKKWITYNEPICAVHASYRAGVFAPGLKLNEDQSLSVLHNFLLGQGKANRVITDTVKDAEVSIAMSVWDVFPVDTSPESVENCRKVFFYKETPTESIDMYMDPIYLGKYPDRVKEDYPRFYERITDEDMKIIANSSNILSVNNYVSRPLDKFGNEIAKGPESYRTAMGLIDPNGIYWACKLLTERYKLPIYITENGTMSDDHISLDGKVHDNTRVDYLKMHLSKMEKILADGIDLRGYYVWSLMDNFEWLKGYSTRFGLVYVDYENELKRIKKDSFYFYKDYIESFNK